jgi:hypothetical protein
LARERALIADEKGPEPEKAPALSSFFSFFFS